MELFIVTDLDNFQTNSYSWGYTAPVKLRNSSVWYGIAYMCAFPIIVAGRYKISQL